MTRAQKRIVDAINSGLSLRQSPFSLKKYGLCGERRLSCGLSIAEFEVSRRTVEAMVAANILVVGCRPGGCYTELLTPEAMGVNQ